MNPRMKRLLLVALVALLPALPAAAQPAPTPGEDRAMAFRPGLGEAQERVPAGKLVVIAYTVVIGAIGLYAVNLGRRATRLERDVERLEDEIVKRGGKLDRAVDFDDSEA